MTIEGEFVSVISIKLFQEGLHRATANCVEVPKLYRTVGFDVATVLNTTTWSPGGNYTPSALIG